MGRDRDELGRANQLVFLDAAQHHERPTSNIIAPPIA